MNTNGLQMKFGSPLNNATKQSPFMMLAITMISSQILLLSLMIFRYEDKQACLMFSCTFAPVIEKTGKKPTDLSGILSRVARRNGTRLAPLQATLKTPVARIKYDQMYENVLRKMNSAVYQIVIEILLTGYNSYSTLFKTRQKMF